MERKQIKAFNRTAAGKSVSGKIRQQGNVPAVMYGGNMKEPLLLSVNPRDIVFLLDSAGGPERQVDLDVEGKTYWAYIREYQVHPVRKTLLHVDFQMVEPGTRIKTKIPLRFVGTAIGEKLGGRVFVAAYDVIVKGDPAVLPNMMDVDVTPLDAGQALYVDQLNYAEGVVPVYKSRYPVVVIKTPKGTGTAEETAAPGAAAAPAGEEAAAEEEKE